MKVRMECTYWETWRDRRWPCTLLGVVEGNWREEIDIPDLRWDRKHLHETCRVLEECRASLKRRREFSEQPTNWDLQVDWASSPMLTTIENHLYQRRTIDGRLAQFLSSNSSLNLSKKWDCHRAKENWSQWERKINWETSCSSFRRHRYVRASCRTLRRWSIDLHLYPRREKIEIGQMTWVERRLPVLQWCVQQWSLFDHRECFHRPSFSTLPTVLDGRSSNRDFGRTSRPKRIRISLSDRSMDSHRRENEVSVRVCCMPWWKIWVFPVEIWPRERWTVWNWFYYSRRNHRRSRRSIVGPMDWYSLRECKEDLHASNNHNHVYPRF